MKEIEKTRIEKKSKEQKMEQNQSKPDDCQSILSQCQAQKEQYLKGWQRAQADLINYKNKERERIEGLLDYAKESLILKLLPIIDNFELAERSLPKEEKENNYLKGFLQIKNQLEEFLKEEGVEIIKAQGKPFDLKYHEIAEEVKKKGEKPGIVVEEIQKGYMLKGKVLRPAKVKITK